MNEGAVFLVALCTVTGLAFAIAGFAFLGSSLWFVGVWFLVVAVMSGWLASLIVRGERKGS